MKILFIRHGVAEENKENDIHSRDFDEQRALTKEGKEKILKGARGLVNLVGRPCVIFSSPLLRAKQTAEILAAVWGEVPVYFTESLRPEEKFASFIPQLLKFKTGKYKKILKPVGRSEGQPVIVIIGHEPYLSQSVSSLIGDSMNVQIKIKKGGACFIRLQGLFKDSFRSGQAQLLWLLTPSMIRKLS